MAFMLLISGFVLSPSIKSQEEGKPLELTLNDALKLALSNSQQLQLAQISIEKAKLYKDVIEFNDKEAKEKEKAGMLTLSTSDFDYKYQTELQKKQAEFQVTMAELSREAAEKMVRYSCIALYYKALLADQNYEIKKSSLKRTQDMLKIAQENFEQGLIAKKDLMDADLKVSQAQTELKSAEVEKEKAFLDLKRVLNIPPDMSVVLKDNLNLPTNEEIEGLQQLIEKAMENRMDVFQAKKGLEIAGYDFDMIKKVYPENTFKYKEKELSLKEAEVKYEDAKNKAENEVRKVYLDFIATKDNLGVFDKMVEFAKESYRLSLLNYKEGIIRSVDLAQAEEALKQVELQKAYGIFQYYLSKLNLENVVYIPLSTSVSQ